MRPGRVLLFLLATLAMLALIGQLIPSQGLRITSDLTLHFPNAKEVLFPRPVEKADIDFILQLPTDSTEDGFPDAFPDSLLDRRAVRVDTSKLAPLAERIRLHYPNNDRSVLFPLFAALESAPGTPHPVRILHYGDSQLEGDRITAYLRNKLQVLFGGNGPGLVSVVEITPHFSVTHEASENWERFSVMERNQPAGLAKRFGAMGAITRFSPLLADTAALDTTIHTATFTLRPNERSYNKARTWQRCRIWFGQHRAPISMEVFANGESLGRETVAPSQETLERSWTFNTPPNELRFVLTGAHSPNVYGVSMEGRNGVVMDNLAMRGASGLELRNTDQNVLRAMYNALSPSLFILQYGGNVLPYMKSTEQAKDYGRAIGNDIARIKRLVPGACVIVIGPSDMSIKEGDQFVTRPYLEDVRDAMKASSLAAGAVFWDMYDAMGGRNSMASWVAADPPLAAEDYTHFSPLGARKIAELFHEALIRDLATYQRQQP